MKKVISCLVFFFLTVLVFGQVPVVVVCPFEVRARAVNDDEALIVKDMLMDALALNSTVSVIDRNVLARTLTEMEFSDIDWADNAKTEILGTTLGADYLVRGTLTQLGNNITFTIFLRDIKTLDVISSVQRQYTAEEIWENNSNGIPGTLTTLAANFVNGVRTEHTKRQQERQQRLAEEDNRRFQESSSLVVTQKVTVTKFFWCT